MERIIRAFLRLKLPLAGGFSSFSVTITHFVGSVAVSIADG